MGGGGSHEAWPRHKLEVDPLAEDNLRLYSDSGYKVTGVCDSSDPEIRELGLADWVVMAKSLREVGDDLPIGGVAGSDRLVESSTIDG